MIGQYKTTKFLRLPPKLITADRLETAEDTPK